MAVALHSISDKVKVTHQWSRKRSGSYVDPDDGPAVGTIVCGLAVTVSASADDFTPDLTGTWNAVEGASIISDERTSAIPDDFDVLKFEIHDQLGPVFRVTQTVKHKSPSGKASHAGEPFQGQSHPAIGAVDGTGPTVVIADVDDTTMYQCTLEDEQTMRCLFAETGEHALAAFALLKRE
ncbi:MAG: hypothetical protein GY798_14295 [Hyphomicrobiales bacterium]|nr:hypothetical protein [Hyphomicrobiales bacterium]